MLGRFIDNIAKTLADPTSMIESGQRLLSGPGQAPSTGIQSVSNEPPTIRIDTRQNHSDPAYIAYQARVQAQAQLRLAVIENYKQLQQAMSDLKSVAIDPATVEAMIKAETEMRRVWRSISTI